MSISCSLGVNTTILVKAWQYCKQLGANVGDIKPNNCHDVSYKIEEEIISILKDCVEGKHGGMSDKVKLTVLSFQPPSTVMCPYYFCQLLL